MAKSRWQEIGDYATKADAEEQISKLRAEDKEKNLVGIKYGIQMKRRQNWYTRNGEDRYIVRMLAPGVY